MAESADTADGRGWCAGSDRFAGESSGVRLFLAARLHVLPEHLSGRTVPRNRSSSLRRRLVGPNSPFLRTYREPVAADDRPLDSSWCIRENALRLDVAQSGARPRVACQGAVVYGDRILCCFHRTVRGVVAPDSRSSFVVIEAGSNGWFAANLQDAIVRLLGHLRFRSHVDTRGGDVDEGNA